MDRTCGACGTVNRVPSRHLTHTGRCGSCKGALKPLAAPVEVDEATFDDVVKNQGEPVLVDFYADWCGPCRTAAPHVARLAQDMAGKVVVLKVNTDKQPALASRFNIRSIPTFVVLHHGKKILEQAGAVDQRTMEQWFPN
jgi:thioredoxin 2